MSFILNFFCRRCGIYGRITRRKDSANDAIYSSENIQFSLYETMIHSELYFVGSMSNLFGEKRIQEDGRAKVIFLVQF